MTSKSLRTRLEALDLSKPTTTVRMAAFKEAAGRLRCAVAAEFGLATARDVWRGRGCPALASLHRWCDGAATPDDAAVWHRIGAGIYFADAKFTTRDYLHAISRVQREF